MRRFLFCLLTCTFQLVIMAQSTSYDLNFDEKLYTIQSFTFENKDYQVRAYENIVYVGNPIDTTYQKMNIYIPEDYYHGKEINGFTRETAPIFLPNGIGGYMPALPMTLTGSKENIFGQRGRRPGANGLPPGGMPRGPRPNGEMSKQSAIHYALAQGYIVASPGARGRSIQNSQGVYLGKAPAGLVDLKAAVCYLRFNDKLIPGSKKHIISNGTSAGGAMSMLLGATGNSSDYKPYLLELGAANVEDNIFAVSAYCPITDLDHADSAYEWQFNGIDTFNAGMMRMLDGNNAPSQTSNELTDHQKEISAQLKTLFPIYVNSLQLKDEKGNLLTLDEQGNGSFKQYVIEQILASAQRAIDKGDDLSQTSWLTVQEGIAKSIDFNEYIRTMGRMKTPPAFDALDLAAPENHLFGTASINAQHFTTFSFAHSAVNSSLASPDIIKMMNPLYYIGEEGSMPANFWHIRYGTIDNNTSLAIESILELYLKNKGYKVNFAFAWDKPHTGDYELEELFEWMNQMIKHQH